MGKVQLPTEDEPALVIHGDALDVLRSLSGYSVDAVITDPPFFTPASHYQSRISWGRSWGDLSILGEYFFTLAKEYKRVLKPSGHLFVFCHDESYPVFYPGVYKLWDFSAALVWDKTRPGLGKTFRHQFELVLWASNSSAHMNDTGRLHTDILRYPTTLSRDRLHPVEKPPELMAELIRVCVPVGGLVLDSFAGSGTTGVACIQTRRRFLGIEIEAEYVEVARQRIHRANGGMFANGFAPERTLFEAENNVG